MSTCLLRVGWYLPCLRNKQLQTGVCIGEPNRKLVCVGPCPAHLLPVLLACRI